MKCVHMSQDVGLMDAMHSQKHNKSHHATVYLRVFMQRISLTIKNTLSCYILGQKRTGMVVKPTRTDRRVHGERHRLLFSTQVAPTYP
jgi:hypothetical protein